MILSSNSNINEINEYILKMMKSLLIVIHIYIYICSVVSDSLWTPWNVVHQASLGIFQERILKWVAMPSFRGSSQPRDQIQVSSIVGRLFTSWATRATSTRKFGMLQWRSYPLQYSWASLVAQMVKNPPATQETWVQSLSWGDLLEEGMATNSNILAWKIPMDRRDSWPTVHGVTKSQAQLSDSII